MNLAEHFEEVKRMCDNSKFMSTLARVEEDSRELSKLEKAMLEAHLDNAHVLEAFIESVEAQMKL